MTLPNRQEWWKTAAIYEVYPRSFQDTDGDGVGDLNGITARLDYLAWLGIDAIWICPFYLSPMADFGYDVADYMAVDPLFGTQDDFDRLLGEAHRRGLRVIVDFVPNHTSDQHPWFRESRSSRSSLKRAWYIWRDPAPGGARPNNWQANFGGDAWTFDEASGQYYYHAFLPQQPDLDWRNPEVREAMYGVLRWWLDRGVDGFRVDVIWHLLKDEDFRDNPPNPEFDPANPAHPRYLELYNADHPAMSDLIAELRGVIDDYEERVLIGEIYLPPGKLVRYYGTAGEGLHLPFNFQLVLTAWERAAIQAAIEEYEAALPAWAWPNWVLSNHDRQRVATRAGPESARMAAMLLLTLRGTPTLYYGDEIGMEDVAIPPERVRDPAELRRPGRGYGRDPARTPMHWDASSNAGFSSGEPWLPLGEHEAVNVEAQQDDPRSLLALYRELLRLRKDEPALLRGALVGLDGRDDLLAYERVAGDDRLVVILNLGAAAAGWPLDGACRVVVSTGLDREGEIVGPIAELRPREGLVVRPLSSSDSGSQRSSDAR